MWVVLKSPKIIKSQMCLLSRRRGGWIPLLAAQGASHALSPPPPSLLQYGVRAVQGGGRSSARETIGRVAAGAVAKKLLHTVGPLPLTHPDFLAPLPACVSCLTPLCLPLFNSLHSSPLKRVVLRLLARRSSRLFRGCTTSR